MKLSAYFKKNRTNVLTFGIVILGFVLMQGLGAMGMLTSSVKGFLVPICAYIVLAVSLNLVVGISGELSLAMRALWVWVPLRVSSLPPC